MPVGCELLRIDLRPLCLKICWLNFDTNMIMICAWLIILPSLNFCKLVSMGQKQDHAPYTRVGTLIVATIYLQLIQNRYMFRSFTVLHYSHQHCVQPVASDVEFVGYL